MVRRYGLVNLRPLACLAVIFFAGGASTAAAPLFAQPQLDGLLRRDCGVSLEPVYYGETFTNARGGISTDEATRYEALLDLPLTLELEKTSLPLPGKCFLLAQNTHGRGLTDDVIGDTQVISNIDSGDNVTQLSECWWEFGLFGDKLAVRLGKQDLNTDFLVMDLAGDFIQSSFGLSPSAGLPSYPNPGMAAVVLGELTESLELKVGIWDVLGAGKWGFSGNDVTFTIGELEYEYALCDGRLPGAVDVGVGYFSGGDVSGVTLDSARGYYVQLEQLIFRENPGCPGDAQGLGAFVSHFPRFSSSAIPLGAVWSNVVGGIVYRGPIPCRNEDVVGAGVAWAKLNRSGTLQETVVEFFYKAQIGPRTSLQPDVQYIASPSGIHRDALAVGLRFQVAF